MYDWSKYPQNSECQIAALPDIYLEYIGHKTDGLFVEAGSFNGINWSNTFPLVLAGWHGLCVEPNPRSFSDLNRNRGHIQGMILENVALGCHIGETTLFLGGSTSTTNPETVAIYSEVPTLQSAGLGLGRKITVPVVTLDSLLAKHNWPAAYDVLSLDIEGSEIDVLSCHDIKAHKPALAIIETHALSEFSVLSAKAEHIDKYFYGHGYYKIYEDSINSIYFCTG